MANPKVAVRVSTFPGSSSAASNPLPPALFSDITSALLSSHAIPRIQLTLQNELDAAGWTSRVRKRVIQLLREEQCSTYDEVMTCILAEVKVGSSNDNLNNSTEGKGGDEDNENEEEDKDYSDRDAEGEGDGEEKDSDGDGDNDDDDEKGSTADATAAAASSTNRRKSTASTAANGTLASASALGAMGKKKRKAREDITRLNSNMGVKVPRRAIREGLKVVRKELEEVCEIVPDGEDGISE